MFYNKMPWTSKSKDRLTFKWIDFQNWRYSYFFFFTSMYTVPEIIVWPPSTTILFLFWQNCFALKEPKISMHWPLNHIAARSFRKHKDRATKHHSIPEKNLNSAVGSVLRAMSPAEVRLRWAYSNLQKILEPFPTIPFLYALSCLNMLLPVKMGAS